MADYTAWYRVGTVALTKNSKIVTGTGTFWLAAGLHTGDMFSTDCVTEYEVASVDSNTQITLRTPYTGNTTTETAYRIIRNFTAQMAAETAANTAALLNDFRRFVDLKMTSIHGKSAYQIACDHGFAGTESEWLESLKGATPYDLAVSLGYEGTLAEWLESLKADNEWTTLDERTEAMTHDPASWKNLYYSGKNLGEFTADHLAAIKNGKYTGMGLGDWFTNTNAQGVTVVDKIAQFSLKPYSNKNGIILWRDTPIRADIGAMPSFNYDAQGTEGEEGYVPSTLGKYYIESNWYQYVRPLFISEIETIYGAANVQGFEILVPTGMNGRTPTGWTKSYSKAHLPTFNMAGFELFTSADIIGPSSHQQFAPLALSVVRPIAKPNYAILAERFATGYYYSNAMKTFGAAGIWSTTEWAFVDNPNDNTHIDYGHYLKPVFMVG